MSLRRALKRDAQRQQKIKEVSALALRAASGPRNLRVLHSALSFSCTRPLAGWHRVRVQGFGRQHSRQADQDGVFGRCVSEPRSAPAKGLGTQFGWTCAGSRSVGSSLSATGLSFAVSSSPTPGRVQLRPALLCTVLYTHI